jgi:hypothetical protein
VGSEKAAIVAGNPPFVKVEVGHLRSTPFHHEQSQLFILGIDADCVDPASQVSHFLSPSFKVGILA